MTHEGKYKTRHYKSGRYTKHFVENKLPHVFVRFHYFICSYVYFILVVKTLYKSKYFAGYIIGTAESVVNHFGHYNRL